MALNIAPAAQQPDNEIVGLLNWSLPFAKIIAAISLAVGFLRILYSSRATLLELNPILGICQLAQGIAFIWHGIQSFRFFRSAKRYVDTEVPVHLGISMAFLSNVWIAYGIALLSGVLALGFALQGKFTPSLLWWVLAPLTVLVFMTLTSRLEMKRSYAGEFFATELPPFARLNVIRTSLVALLSVGLGLLLTICYFMDLLKGSPLDGVSTLLYGLGFLSTGVALGFYWWAVREIHRNPSLIYFERTLEKLNFYWLIATCIGFPLLLIASFF